METAPVPQSGQGVSARLGTRRPPCRRVAALLVSVMFAAGCGSQPTPTAPPAAASPTAVATVAPSPAPSPSSAPVEPAALYGVWEGILGDGPNALPTVLRFYDCGGAMCAESEYASGDPTSVLCAAQLTVGEPVDGAFDAVEEMTFQPWECLATTLALRPGADGTLGVEQYGDRGQTPFAKATFTRTATDGKPSPPPIPGPVAGLGTPTASIDLGGGTTQYTAEGFGSLWLPIVQGSVMRVDAATGQVQGRVEIGDPTPVELHADPHAVAADADGIWVTSVAEHALVFIDPATMTLGRRIPLDVEPYALAIDGRRAWVTSFQGDVLVSVDLDSGKVVSTTTVPKPTGVAVGAGRAWVVAHRANQVYAVNTKTAKVNVIVELGLPSPNGVCGACVENIVFAAGALWTANNEGRSVTRIDPHGAAVPERIELPLRVWAVAAGGGRVWAGQFDPASATEGWQVAAIDPRSNEVTTYPLPAQSVAWAGDALWTIVPAGRTDILTRVDIGG